MARFPSLDERRKRQLIEDELSKGKILIHLDPRQTDVDVPEHFREDPCLALNFSHHFPFTNMTVGPLSIEAFLSFGGDRYQCKIPYGSVFCVTQTTTNEANWFPESLPEEMKEALEQPHEEQTAETQTESNTQEVTDAQSVTTAADREPAMPRLTLLK